MPVINARFEQNEPTLFQNAYRDTINRTRAVRGMFMKGLSFVVADRRPTVTDGLNLKYVTGGCLVIEAKVTEAVNAGEVKASIGIECLQCTQGFDSPACANVLVQDLRYAYLAFGPR
jgi:hypothetical protein